MRQRPLLVAFAAAAALLLSACGGQGATSDSPTSEAAPAALADRGASGEDLANAWFGLLALTGREAGQVATTPEEVEEGMALVRPYLEIGRAHV